MFANENVSMDLKNHKKDKQSQFESIFNEERNIIEVIAKDIANYAKDNKLTNRAVIKQIAIKSNVSERTLDRFLEPNQAFKPHFKTIFKIYSHLYETSSITEVMTKTPSSINEYIKKNHNQYISNLNETVSISESILQGSLTTSTLFNKIYLMTGGEYGSDIESIRKAHGAEGIRILDLLASHEFIEVLDDERVIRKKKLCWDNNIRRNFIKTLINDVYVTENEEVENKSLLSVFHGEVSSNDYKKIREKLKKCQFEILELINQSNPKADDIIKLASAGMVMVVESITGEAKC